MANPSPDAINLIRGRVSDLKIAWNQPAATIAGLLNASLIPNEAPAPTALPVLAESDLMGMLVDPAAADPYAGVRALLNWPNLALLKADIAAQNHEGVALWADRLPLLGFATAAQGTAIREHVTTPVPVVDWPAQVPWPVARLGRLVDADDVRAATPPEGI